jgi:hypothetical protein
MSDPSRARKVFNTVLATGLLWVFKAKQAVQARRNPGGAAGFKAEDSQD